jgi:signal transduction histidine kinase/CheY-like chemotaxis protein
MRKRLSIRQQLRVLVLATAAPLLAFAAALVFWHSHAERELLEQEAVRSGTAAMASVDRELAGAVTGLQVLAASPALAAGDFRAFHAQARAAVGIAGNSVIILYDRAGTRLVSTAVPYGTPVAARRDMSTLSAPFETGKPHITRLFVSETVKQPTLGIVVPVFVDGRVRYVLGAGLLSNRLSGLMRDSGLPREWPAAVLDQEGTIIARTSGPEYVGKKALPANWERIARTSAQSGTFEGPSQEGRRGLIAFARSDASGWTTAMSVPLEAVNGRLYRSLALVAMAGLLVFALALFISWRVGDRIVRPVLALQRAAKAMERGLFPELVSSGIAQFDALAASMREAAGQIREREERLSDSLKQLQAAHEELANAHEQLRGEQGKKDQFIATLAHELRNPLAPIRTGIFVLQRSPPAEAAEKTLAMMDRQLAHMVRLIDDLLDVSRIARGKLVLQREDAVLQDIVLDACIAAEPLIAQGGHTFTRDIQLGPIWVNADRTRLAQVITNVLNNAAKFTPAGGSIHLKLSRCDGAAEIEVTDSGVGIPRHRLHDIFELFSQVLDGTTGREPGLGIGLSLAKLLVELHGGSIEARSQGRGHGSTFVIRMPAVPAPGKATLQTRGQSQETAAPRRLLVVDDNRDAAESLAALLSSLGHAVTVANDGTTAIAMARNRRFDLVLLDIGMPGMDGFEVCRRLRAIGEYRSVPIVALTGWGAAGDRARSSEAGFSAHLVKPASLEELECVIRESTARDGALVNPG